MLCTVSKGGIEVYNRYISGDADAFRDLYRPVEHQRKKETKSGGSSFKIDQLLGKLRIHEIGLLPLLVLALLLLEADEEERMIMLVLAAVLGI